ncbi:ion transport peptide isoform X2 [Schistocerca americana]|uniref:ion transport peptide isoform X2 n=1 Tax=Schistocerca americana TaxID=7009 RepID=UPI001F4FEF1B|nr:ion transport peptide isoform X2 [Schistocerca americana]
MCVSPRLRVQYCETECPRRRADTHTSINASRPARPPTAALSTSSRLVQNTTMHHQKQQQQQQKQQGEAPCRHLQWRLSGVVLCVLVVASLVSTAASSPLDPHHLAKRSFFDIQCKGVYDKSIFARLDRICEDCYNLFREPQLHSLCRSDCFKSPYFKGCLQALLLIDEEEKFNQMVEILGKK